MSLKVHPPNYHQVCYGSVCGTCHISWSGAASVHIQRFRCGSAGPRCSVYGFAGTPGQCSAGVHRSQFDSAAARKTEQFITLQCMICSSNGFWNHTW